MGNQRIGEGRMSKKSRNRANRRNTSPAVKQRQRVARQLGKAMYKAGGRAGHKPIPADRIPNQENYRQVMYGMGLKLHRVDLRKSHNP